MPNSISKMLTKATKAILGGVETWYVRCPYCKDKCLFKWKENVRYYHCTWCGEKIDSARVRGRFDVMGGNGARD